MADGFSRCYSKTLGSRRDLEAKLRAEKKTDEEIQSAVAAAVKAGTLPAPSKGMMSYRDYDKRDRIQHLWVMSLPNATPESVGVSTVEPARRGARRQGTSVDDAAGHAGRAHHDPDQSAGEDSRPSPIRPRTRSRRRSLPLPEDLRPGATVYKYDPKTGDRIVAAQRDELRGVHAARRRRVHLVLQRGQRRRAAISARSCEPRGRATRKSRRPWRRPPRPAPSSRRRSARCRTGSMGRRIGFSCCGCCRCRVPRRSRLACPTAVSATNRSAATDGRG